MSEERSYVIEDRLKKLEQLRERGIEPFGYSYRVTHSSAQAKELLLEGEHENATSVRVAGRLVSMRGHGKTSFAHLSDRAGKIQLYFRKDDLGEDAFGLLNLLDTLRSQNVTVMVATHDLDQAARHFDRIMLLNRRMIAFDEPQKVLQTNNLLQAYGGRLKMDPQGSMLVDDCCPPE